jgi:hypothetical protein
MSYIGNSPVVGNFSKLDDISASFNGVLTQFNLTAGSVAINAGSAANCIISLNNVVKEPGVAYTVNGSNITFATPPTNGTTFFGVVLGNVLDVGVPTDASITNVKIGETIAVNKGGTGATTLTGLVKGNGTGAMSAAVSGTDIKTVNGTSLLGSGDVTVGGGSWIYLSTVTANNSATVDIETTFDSTYDMYVIVGSNILPATTGADLYARLKVGGAYDTANNYRYVGESTTTSTYRGHYDNGSAQSDIRISNNSIYTTTTSDTGHILIYVSNPSSTSIRKYITWVGGGITDSGSLYKLQGTGINIATTALTGVRLYMHNGNMTSGTFRLYGIKNS